ncbi:MAG: alpha/beta hydrolase [Anaerolineae bacterium]|nr:alpha/beta hydrolase [Anaerolineae bacterium]
MDADKTIALRDGRQIVFAEYGDPNGIPIIGFHGMPGSRVVMKVFHEVASQLGIRIIAPERPGFGLTSPNPSGTLASYAQDVAALCDTLNLDRFIVMGTSGGGPYSLACAYYLKDRVTVAGVVSGIGPLYVPGSLTGMMRVNRIMFTLGRISPALVGSVLPRLIRSSLPSMEKHVQQGTSSSDAIDAATFAIIVDDQRESIRTGGHGIALDMKNLWRNWNIPFQEIETRVLLWHGDRDDLAPTMLARYLAEQMPNCEATFYSGEDHTGPLTHHQEEILNALKAAHLAVPRPGTLPV